jgi:Gpi18-like mannosyltransferase
MTYNAPMIWASIIIAGIIILVEFFWIDKSSLAFVIMGLAVAVLLQGIYLLTKER